MYGNHWSIKVFIELEKCSKSLKTNEKELVNVPRASIYKDCHQIIKWIEANAGPFFISYELNLKGLNKNIQIKKK